ncbi:MAG: putative monovalent cation/H+ antiporter subunit A, partial [Bacteroidota bacterium]
GITAWYLQYLPRIADGEIIRESTPWVPGFDVHLSFVLDGLSIFFVLLVAGIGTFIFIYASGYVGRHAQAGRFYLYIVSFMASMIGLVLADNIITVYVFFELTSFTSFFLIAFNHEAPSSRRAGWQSLLVTNVGGLALLASVILMANIAGSMEISEILRQPEALQASPLYLPILLCLLAAVFTKSAQYPFYFWLPNAMEAPTPVSAYLHSATMVKAGVYLLARFSPALSGTTEWLWLVTGFGAFTMVVTAWLSLGYTDLKRILAYSTVMALGLLTMLLGVGGEAAIVACVVFIVVHALYKASLFMVAGAIDHEAGTRNVADLRGLRKAMPVTFAAAIIAGLSMAGFPPFIGFIGKEIVYEAALGQETIFGLLVGISVLANVAIVGAAAVVAIKPFLGEASPAALSAHRAPISLWLGPVVLAGIGLVFGLVPSLVDKNIIAPAAATILGAPDVRVYLSLWHGINVPLLLSGVTVAVGVGLYLAWEKIRVSGGMGWLRRWLAEAPENGYDHSLNGMMWFAKAQTNFIQTGVLRYSMGIVFAVAGLLILGTVLIRVGLPAVDLATFGEIRAYEWILSATIILSAFGAVLTPSRLGAVLILGVSGLSIALIYISFGAPDLAMTQFLVETLTVIIFVLIVIKLPRYVRLKSSSRGRVRDIAIASVTGLAVTLVMLAILRRPFSSTMAEYYAAASYPEAYGRNIVNVILVDFRAFDTFGEIIVLAVAGLGIFSLIWLTIGKDRADVQAGDEDVKHSAEVTDR